MNMKLLFILGENGKFSGGFDINVFEKVHKTGNFLYFDLIDNDVTHYTRMKFMKLLVLSGDLSILPDVSVDLLVNTIEGPHLIQLSFY